MFIANSGFFEFVSGVINFSQVELTFRKGVTVIIAQGEELTQGFVEGVQVIIANSDEELAFFIIVVCLSGTEEGGLSLRVSA